MKFKSGLSIFIAGAALMLTTSSINSPLNKNMQDTLNRPKKVLIKKEPLVDKKQVKNLQKELDVQFRINLAEFKNRMYIGGVQEDSSAISPGSYRRRSPVYAFRTNVITIRPSFTPTASERGQFSTARPDRTNHPQKPNNPLGRCRLVLESTYRMHGTSLVSSIAGYDENGNVQGHYRSNGCIRHDNYAIERMVGRLLINSKISYITKYLRPQFEAILDSAKKGLMAPEDIIRKTKPGYQIHIELEKDVDIIVNYRLWNENIIYTDSSIKMTLYRDIYDYMQGRAPSKKAKFDKNLEGNSFSLQHLIKDLNSCGIYDITPTYLVDSIYENLYDTLKIMMKNNTTVAKEVEIMHDGKLKSLINDYTNYIYSDKSR
jgi:hypothetical protein